MSTARRQGSAADTAASGPPRSGAGIPDGGAKKPSLRTRLRRLYHGSSRQAVRFRYGLLLLDLVVITFVVVSSFFPGHQVSKALDLLFGSLVLVEFCARLSISPAPLKELVHPLGLADIIVIVSFVAPLAGASFAFLRTVRVLRLFRSYQLVSRLRLDFPFFSRNEDAIFSIVHLCVFLLIATSLVLVSQQGRNPQINDYGDALYFTVTTLTTTGFGDIILEGKAGRLLAVVIMISGVTLFLRLAQTLFRPRKVHHECAQCGLGRHDPDAVHCKHCGATIHIRTEGVD